MINNQNVRHFYIRVQFGQVFISDGHNPWGIVYWGRMPVGQKVVGHNVVWHDDTGVNVNLQYYIKYDIKIFRS